MVVTVERTGQTLGDRIAEPKTFLQRGLGLTGRQSIETGEGLWIRRCNAIHMFGMKFPIDVAFVSKDGTVVKMIHGIRPGRVSGIYVRARDAVELPAGTLRRHGVKMGDRLVAAP